MTAGRLVVEDIVDLARPAAVCRLCGGACGGLRLEAELGTFVHRDPISCAMRDAPAGRHRPTPLATRTGDNPR